MEKHPFGGTAYEVSTLGFGSAPVGFLEVDQERAAKILNFLLDRGVNLIDTAAGYPGSEVLIGESVAHRRSEYVLVSKCGRAVEGLPGEEWSERLILATVEQSLRRLKTDHLDVMLLHSCERKILEKGEAMGALVKARDAGKIRYAGYSGDDDAAAYAARLPDVSVVETSINICDQSNIDRVLPIATTRRLGILAKRPIANAAWKSFAVQEGMYKEYASEYAARFQEMGLTPAALGYEGGEAAWPEIALRFTLSQPGVHTAIIGTTRLANAEANLKAAEAGPLPPETVERIRAAFRAAEARSGRRWNGLT